MATPTLGTINLEEISTCESTSDFTKFDTLDSDLKKEGSNGISGTFRNDNEVGYYTNASTGYSGANKHIRFWLVTTNIAYMETVGNGGYELLLYDGSTTEYQTMLGSDTYSGGWFNMVFSTDLFTTLTLANLQRWGVRVQHHTSAKNVDNLWIDYIRYLDGIYVTGGTLGDEISLSGIAIQDADYTNGYGIILAYEGVYIGYGELQIGNGATTTYFEMDGEVLVFSDQPVAAGLYTISGDGTGANIVITNSTIQAGGTGDNTRIIFDMSSTDIDFTMSGTVLNRCGTVDFASGQTITNCTFNDCDEIDPNGATLSGCTIKNSNVSGTTVGSLMVNVDTEGESCTDMNFSDYTGATTYAIYVAASVTEFDMTNWIFDDPDNTTSYALYWAGTSGTLTVNALGSTNLVTAGCTAASGGSVVVVGTKSLTLTGLIAGSEVRAYVGTDPATAVYVDGIESSGTSIVLNHTEGGNQGYINIIKADYEAMTIWLTYSSSDAELPVQQRFDRNYENP